MKATMTELLEKAELARVNKEPVLIEVFGCDDDAFTSLKISSGNTNPIVCVDIFPDEIMLAEKVSGKWFLLRKYHLLNLETEKVDEVEREFLILKA